MPNHENDQSSSVETERYALSEGIDPAWFGVIFTINMELALITPPVGMSLYVAMGVGKSSLKEVVRGVWPFLLILTFGLIMIMLIPGMSLWLANVAN